MIVLPIDEEDFDRGGRGVQAAGNGEEEREEGFHDRVLKWRDAVNVRSPFNIE
jgi:hypothetical protein